MSFKNSFLPSLPLSLLRAHRIPNPDIIFIHFTCSFCSKPYKNLPRFHSKLLFIPFWKITRKPFLSNFVILSKTFPISLNLVEKGSLTLKNRAINITQFSFTDFCISTSFVLSKSYFLNRKKGNPVGTNKTQIVPKENFPPCFFFFHSGFFTGINTVRFLSFTFFYYFYCLSLPLIRFLTLSDEPKTHL